MRRALDAWKAHILRGYLSLATINRLKAILISLRLIAKHIRDLRYEAGSWPALHLHNNIQRLCDIRFDGRVRDENAALQNAGGESGYALGSTVSVDRGDGATVPSI